MLTDAQREEFDLNGFLVIENALTPAEVQKYLALVEQLDARLPETFGGKSRKPGESLEVRNAVAVEPKLMDILMHESAFPAVLDLMGHNICMTTSHVFVRPPTPGAESSFKAINWHKDGPPQADTPPGNGRWPWQYTKIGYFLTDLTIPDAGALRVVPGSHRVLRPAWKPGAPDPYGYVEIRCKPGTAVIFENRLWHAVGPNYSNMARKNIYIGYCWRWMRPIDYVQPDPALLECATPEQRQLLGDVKTPIGYILPAPADVPLKAWMEKRTGQRVAAQRGGMDV
jgi:ectoine hydroxylase-related dioxygenase (phytanoyl-CoA dioxygenase family)